jgi:hypothetical protein
MMTLLHAVIEVQSQAVLAQKASRRPVLSASSPMLAALTSRFGKAGSCSGRTCRPAARSPGCVRCCGGPVTVVSDDQQYGVPRQTSPTPMNAPARRSLRQEGADVVERHVEGRFHRRDVVLGLGEKVPALQRCHQTNRKLVGIGCFAE